MLIVEPPALRWKKIGIDRLQAGAWQDALSAFDRADSLQTDRDAIVLIGELAGRRSLALAQLGRLGAAADQAQLDTLLAIARPPGRSFSRRPVGGSGPPGRVNRREGGDPPGGTHALRPGSRF